MKDETDKAKEIAKPQADPETILRVGLIQNQSMQENWRETLQHSILGQEESATDMFYKPGAVREANQKFELFDSSSHEATQLAMNIVPKVPELGQPVHVLKDESETPKITQALDNYMTPPTLLLPDLFVIAGLQAWSSTEKPLEGLESQLMESTTKANPQAWEEAAASFSGALKNVPVALLKAYTRNELDCYGREDLAQDNSDVYSYSDEHGKNYKALYLLEVSASKAIHWDQEKEYYANNSAVVESSKHIKNVLRWMK